MNNVVNNVKLIDSEELLRRYPALRSRKGKDPLSRLRWLERNRAIPLIKINRLIFFDPQEIDRWIDSQRIPVTKGGE